MDACHEIHLQHLVLTAAGALPGAPLYFVHFFVPGPDGVPLASVVKTKANKPWEAIAKARATLPARCYGWRIGSTASVSLPHARKAARHSAIGQGFERAGAIRAGRSAGLGLAT